MREGKVTRRRTESHKVPVKVSRMGRASKDRLGRVLEEWLAEARIRYTYAGD